MASLAPTWLPGSGEQKGQGNRCTVRKLAHCRTVADVLAGFSGERLKEKRDRVLLALLLMCGIRRHEAVDLDLAHIQQCEEYWAIVDLRGKAGHTRTDLDAGVGEICSTRGSRPRISRWANFLLGHIAIQTTEEYLGCKQRIRGAVNDKIGIEPPV